MSEAKESTLSDDIVGHLAYYLARNSRLPQHEVWSKAQQGLQKGTYKWKQFVGWVDGNGIPVDPQVDTSSFTSGNGLHSHNLPDHTNSHLK